MSVALVTVLLFGGLAGWIGWRAEGSAVHRRSQLTDPMESPFARPMPAMRRRMRRLLVTALYAATGLCLGVLFLTLIRR